MATDAEDRHHRRSAPVGSVSEDDLADENNGPSTSWRIQVAGRELRLGRIGTLALSRSVDQGVLGLASILLAWRLGIDGFVPVSALLVINSFSVVGSDFGLGSEILRSTIGTCSRRAVRRVRTINGGIALVGLAIALVLPEPVSVLVACGGLIWLTSAEAFVRKQSLIRQGRVSRAAGAEMTGSAVVAAGIGIALVFPEHATAIVGIALAGKHAAEATVARGWADVLASKGASSWEIWLWLTSILNFSIANVDYILVATFVSARTFAIYSLGYRLAALFVSQVSYVVNRVTLVDFGESHRKMRLAHAYQKRRRQMFVIGMAAGAVTALGAPLIPLLIGSQWRDSMVVVLALACAVPWRMCSGLGYSVMLAAGSARRATAWEASRLVAVIAILSLGGLFGLASFTFAAVVVAIGTAVGYDRAAIRISGAREPSPLMIGTPVAFGCAALATWLLL